MVSETQRLCLIGLMCITVLVTIVGQTPAQSQKRKTTTEAEPRRKGTPQPSPDGEQSPGDAQQEVETLKIDTNLVTVPVIATDINGIYVPDLGQGEFNVWEEGAKQEIAFFATVSAPFHVVLMLDTSASTQDKLGSIQRAAVAFVEQLQPADRVKVISFDNQVNDLNDFTNDRAGLKEAIYKTRPGQGTKLYDALELALNSIRRIEGRKAIVLFTDGVDWHSDQASFDSTLRGLDEEGVIVYPIRYDTREETERIARQQAEDQSPQLPTIGVIRTPPTGTTVPTFPSDDPDSVPTSGTRSKTGPLGLPLPSEILRRRRSSDPNADPNRLPQPGGMPPASGPTGRWPDGRNDPGSTNGRTARRSDDSISAMLDQLYITADGYLKELANKTGGRVLRADTLGSLPDAFAKIAAELRTQYALGYYPSNKARDGQYRKIKVSSTRKSVIVRARPGYRAPSGH